MALADRPVVLVAEGQVLEIGHGVGCRGGGKADLDGIEVIERGAPAADSPVTPNLPWSISASRASEEGGHGALADAEAEIVYRGCRAEALGQPADLYDRHAG